MDWRGDLRWWMQLNESNIKGVLFCSDSIKSITNSLGNLSNLVKTYVKNIGVILDSAIKCDKQVSAIVKASFFQL